VEHVVIDFLTAAITLTEYKVLPSTLKVRSGSVHSPVEEFISPAVHCLVFEALSEWHSGEAGFRHAIMAEAISAREGAGRYARISPCTMARRVSRPL